MDIHRVDHAQDLAGGIRQRDGRRIERVLVEILRHAGIRRPEPLGEQLEQQLRDPWQRQNEDGRDRDIEQRMEIRRQTGWVRIEDRHRRQDRVDQRQRHEAAQDPHGEIAERHPEL